MDAATNAHFPMDLWSRRMDRLYTSASEAHYSGKHTHTFTQTQYSKQLKLDPMAKEPPIHAAAKSFDDGWYGVCVWMSAHCSRLYKTGRIRF